MEVDFMSFQNNFLYSEDLSINISMNWKIINQNTCQNTVSSSVILSLMHPLFHPLFLCFSIFGMGSFLQIAHK